MELKAYKILAQIQGNMLSWITAKARNRVEYGAKDTTEAQKLCEVISDPLQWDHHGLLDKADKKVLETIEYLLNDEQKEIRRYKEWKPIK